MESQVRRAFLVLFVISVTLFFGPQLLWAAEPATTEDPSKALEPTVTDPEKKENIITTKGREYCTECIDNSECISCHGKKINERKFAQSVHGGLSCNGCHWDITDVKSHLKAKGAKIHAEPVTCHRCHKREGAEHYASAHFINDVQCRDCHQTSMR
jgi:hypothetical protein